MHLIVQTLLKTSQAGLLCLFLQAVLSLPDYATPQARKLVNAQPSTKLTINSMISAQH